MNGDGKVDLVVARSASYLAGGASTGEPDLSVLLGIDDGTFKPAVNSTPLGAPAFEEADNFNRVGDVNAYTSTGADLHVRFGKGDGTFASFG